MQKSTMIPSLICLALGSSLASAQSKKFEHVLLISIDGAHELDVSRYIKEHPKSALSQLASQGTTYAQARTSFPSDSFPGLLSMLTGGGPGSTGVWYDNSYARELSAPGSDCSVRGTAVVLDEAADLNPDALDAGGGLNPDALPRDPARACAVVYPHNYLRVNTLFEVVHESGKRTAWADKHPAYDIVQGPSGVGVDDLYTPEIAANGTTKSVSKTEAYDDTKVDAIVHQIMGKDHSGKETVGVPTVFGMNFQALSVAQKLSGGGYLDAVGTPSAWVIDALAHTDQSLARIMSTLDAEGLRDSTLVIVTAKHGQSPIDPAQRKIVDEARIPAWINTLEADALVHATQDDAGLYWLSDSKLSKSAADLLMEHKLDASINQVYEGDRLRAQFHSAITDPRAPDLVIQPETGVIFASPTSSKIAEHGGDSEADRHVALIVSSPCMPTQVIDEAVSTTQIAPTILHALGLDPVSLQAVQMEKTQMLPGLMK